jgi:diguanylate cyclase (GGDEF)-like protein
VQTQLNKLGRGIRKPFADTKGIKSSPFGPLANLNPPPPSYEDSRGAGLRGEAAVDLFQTLLSRVNRELTKLLRDIATGSEAGIPGANDRRIRELLMRAVRCAAKQCTLQAELGNLALKDDLTGLYNRRGFHALAERQLKLGHRSGRDMLLFFIDLDGLKRINDSFGHAEGDQALQHAAEVLRKTFRDSDIIARLGGDEFAVLAIEAKDRSETTIMSRLRKYLKALNSGAAEYAISLSVGLARFDHANPSSIRQLLLRADQAMYAQKRSRTPLRVATGAGYLC